MEPGRKSARAERRKGGNGVQERERRKKEVEKQKTLVAGEIAYKEEKVAEKALFATPKTWLLSVF